jgi:hypothetical protein
MQASLQLRLLPPPILCVYVVSAPLQVCAEGEPLQPQQRPVLPGSKPQDSRTDAGAARRQHMQHMPAGCSCAGVSSFGSQLFCLVEVGLTTEMHRMRDGLSGGRLLLRVVPRGMWPLHRLWRRCTQCDHFPGKKCTSCTPGGARVQDRQHMPAGCSCAGVSCVASQAVAFEV